ncbi:MAG: hypothetical protein F4X35_02460 [Alphaproteobacteria bacterium]|nr:hypothetical protein [Alphaproteobacteria bacterium]
MAGRRRLAANQHDLAAAFGVLRPDLGKQAALVEAQDEDMALDQFGIQERLAPGRLADIVPGVVVQGGCAGGRAERLQHFIAGRRARGQLLHRLFRHHIAAMVDGGRAAGKHEAKRDKHGGNPYHGRRFPAPEFRFLMARRGPAVNLGALKRLIFRPQPSDASRALYRAAVEAARRPAVMLALGVPDTLDGRFELVTLHAALLLRRVQRAPALAGLGQELVDLFVADMDQSLREMGAGDLSVGRKVKRMASAFYGRLDAYSDGLDRGGDLAAAAERNLYGTLEAAPGQPERAAAYIRAVEAALAAEEDARLAAGGVSFPDAPPC